MLRGALVALLLIVLAAGPLPARPAHRTARGARRAARVRRAPARRKAVVRVKRPPARKAAKPAAKKPLPRKKAAKPPAVKPAAAARPAPGAASGAPADRPGTLPPPPPAPKAPAGRRPPKPMVAKGRPGVVNGIRAIVPDVGFRTDAEFDLRLDGKSDYVTVCRQGESWEAIDRALQSWRALGYVTNRGMSLGADAGGFYTGGRADGKSHVEETELDAAGKPVTQGGAPLLLPTPGWLDYLKDGVRRAIDSGASGVNFEAAPLPASAGYSKPFKDAWQELYQSPWQPPHESPTSFFKAARVRSDSAVRAVDELLRATREYAGQKARDTRFYLTVQSPLGCASGTRVFPAAAVSRLPLDGLVAQLSPGAATEPAPYEGKSEPRLFEQSWLHYSYFANLLEGTPDRAVTFSADTAEDTAKSWPEAIRRYREMLCASLLFPQGRGYQVLPPPLPGPGGSPALSPTRDDLTMLANIEAALKEVPGGVPADWVGGGTPGIGVLVLDTAGWQRGGPRGSSMRSFYGLALPLLERGIPVQAAPGERAADPGFLARFKVLLLSYDAQKPLGPDLNSAIAEWVRAGGTLLLACGEDAYNDIGEWWTRDGYPSPQDHLLRECGVGVTLARRSVRNPAALFAEVLKGAGDVKSRETRTVQLPSAMAGKPVFLRISDPDPLDATAAWLGRVRVIDGGRVRADFGAGSGAERPFLAEDVGSAARDGGREAEGDRSFVYRFNRLGPAARLELELAGEYQVSLAAGAEPVTLLQPAGKQGASVRVGSAYPVTLYPLTGGEALYRIAGEEGAPVWSGKAGQGGVVFAGVPAAFFSDSQAGADLLRGLVRTACERAGLAYQEAPLLGRRGQYVAAHALGRTVQLKGLFIDLFRPDAPLVEDPRLPYREPVLFKQVHLTSRIPTLLHASRRVRVLEAGAGRMRLLLDGPKDTWGIARIYPAGMSLAGVEAANSLGERVEVEARIDGRTLHVRYPQLPNGLYLTLRWIRPEARLTK